MIVRYDLRPDPSGWTIDDRITNKPTVVEGLVSSGLSFEDADDLVNLFNTLHMLKRAPTLD